MVSSGKSAARDAALRRVGRAKRWLIAGAIGLTGVFSAVASQAFPGRTLKNASAAPPSDPPATATPAPSSQVPDDQTQVPDPSAQDPNIAPPDSVPLPSDSGAGTVSGGS